MRRMLLSLAVVAGCTGGGPPPPGGVLAIGDSVMAWNGGRGIPEVAAAALDLPLRDASQSLARIDQPNPALSVAGFDVARQWRRNAGAWDWVMLTGGANDLRPACATPDEGAAIDALLSGAQTGAIPDLVAEIRARGSDLALVGYYDGLAGASTGFTPCQPAFDVLNARLARLAAGDPGTVFVDAGDVIDVSRADLYARDRIHPSVEGSRRIGTALAAAMAAR